MKLLVWAPLAPNPSKEGRAPGSDQSIPRGSSVLSENKKADTVEYRETFDRVGLLVNGSPARAGCPSSSFPTNSIQTEVTRTGREQYPLSWRSYRFPL